MANGAAINVVAVQGIFAIIKLDALLVIFIISHYSAHNGINKF